MRNPEPPLSEPRSRSPLFFIGMDSHGNWVVQDQECRKGGLFIDRTEALKFALFGNGNRPRAVVMVPGIFEFDMNRKASLVHEQAIESDLPPRRRAA
jgi:hypothetical protein